MKRYRYIKITVAVLFTILLMSCVGNTPKVKQKEVEHEEEENSVVLSTDQVKAIDLKIGKIQKKNLNSFISTNGIIGVPPQEKVDVSAIIGANIADIKVLEGQKVKKGQILANLEHPQLIDIQVEYKKAYNELKFLKEEYKRLKILSDRNIASGKEFQKVESKYNTAKASFFGLKAKIEMIGIDSENLITENPIRYIAVKSPISGIVSKISVNNGKYVGPQSEMFEVINTKHLHADLSIYEKDLGKIKVGYKVILTLNEDGKNEYEGKVISVGKNFDEKTRAITIQVEISPVPEELVPGVFVKGRILIGEKMLRVVPHEAVVTEGDKSYIFIVEDEVNEHNKIESKEHKEKKYDDEGIKLYEHKANIAIKLTKTEIIKGIEDRGYIEIKLLKKLKVNSHIALNGAYFLLAEIKKSESEHTH